MYPKLFGILLIFLLPPSPGWGQKIFFSGNDDNAIYLCEDGRVFMCGENNTGQLGRGSLIPSNVPVEITGINGSGTPPRCKQVQIEGVSTFIALTNSGDTVLAWGPNEYGQAGDGTAGVKTAPVIVKGPGGKGILDNVIQIATGNYTAYALKEDGKVVSWGANNFGQAGAGNTSASVFFPSYVLKAPGDTLKNVKAISGGGVFCLALLCDGTVWAWGRNNVGQLGQGNTTNSEYAIPVKNSAGTGKLSNIIKIEAGDNCGFALSAGDTLYCWGPNWDGRLGTGSNSDQFLPGYVRNSAGNGRLAGVVDIASGQGHGLALLSDQSVYAWGVNKMGQIGNNDTTGVNLPVRVKDASGTGFLTGVNYVAAGDEFSMARTTGNQVFVWGRNTLGQLGLNDHVMRTLPVLLDLPCSITPTAFPGIGKMEHEPAECIGSNSGVVFLTGNNSAIVRWEQSQDGFATYTPLNNTEYVQPYANLTGTTSFRAVLKECKDIFYSPVATVVMDSLTLPGKVESSATVRINRNHDTLWLREYKGTVIRWEYSHDNFLSEILPAGTPDPHLEYFNLSRTTFYRALVRQGACPAAYSTTAEIRMADETAIRIYNGFTPDGDHYNDEWIIDLIELFPGNKVEIFNRWGQPVYRASPYDNVKNVWRGESNVGSGQPLTDGTYFYVVDLGEGTPPFKGYVVISREE